jgi:hypothetical protein
MRKKRKSQREPENREDDCGNEKKDHMKRRKETSSRCHRSLTGELKPA